MKVESVLCLMGGSVKTKHKNPPKRASPLARQNKRVDNSLTEKESELIRLRCKILLKHKIKPPRHKFKVKSGDRRRIQN